MLNARDERREAALSKALAAPLLVPYYALLVVTAIPFFAFAVVQHVVIWAGWKV